MDIKNKTKQVPGSPGIYIMKDSKDRIIYVGKAKNLRNRLKSYFQRSSFLDARKSKMVREISDFDYIITGNELEALVLEANYIKKTRPAYNIILRDDKNYPYIKLTINEQWPRLVVVRKIAKDGSLYFGPYVPTGTMREILNFIRRNFTLRTCRYNLDKPFRPCVQYQMSRCHAPCASTLRKQTDRDKYMETVNEVTLFITGKKKELLSNLRKKMNKLSEDLKFEDAAKIRDRLKAIEGAWETQRVISPELKDIDIIGFYREKQEASVFMLFIRNGAIIGQKNFFLKKLDTIKNKDLIASVIEQFYSKEMPLPSKIILPFKTELATQKLWLRKKKGKHIGLSTAKGKKESELLKMASDNAYHSFRGHKETKTSRALEDTLITLKKLLKLKAVPQRIEAVDVSNLTGSEAVGAFIVWENGNFIKDDYRLYKIKTVQGIDDFAMIKEIVGRHLKGLAEGRKKLPDLILIDGGKGQLKSAVKAMKPFNIPVEVAAIAKAKQGQTDRIYLSHEKGKPLSRGLPNKNNAIPLDPFTASTHMLQRIRDESHRFAISHHKRLRTKRILQSPLESIKSIGKARRLLLLRHFGSINAIRQAPINDIISLKGINKKTAILLKTYLVNDSQKKGRIK